MKKGDGANQLPIPLMVNYLFSILCCLAYAVASFSLACAFA